ncbi:MAG: hypothetical protein IJA91_01875 [Clostridia bacterium]|nr:hypothetical protein [Clostridia bacterium]
MKRKLGGAAIIGGIASVLTILLDLIVGFVFWHIIYNTSLGLNNTVYLIGYDISNYLLPPIVSFVGMLVAIMVYKKITVKRSLTTKKVLLVSALTGIVHAAAWIFVIVPLVIWLRFIISFILFTAGALFITMKSSTPNHTGNENAQAGNEAKNIQKAITNNTVSEKAQFAYNRKLIALSETATQIDEVIEAKLFAQAVELQLLKSPASATFCELEEMTVAFVDGNYIVSGYVDSQNSYGAMIRSPFKLTVYKQDGIWQAANKFVSTSATIGARVFSKTLLYWIIGIILSAASFAVFYYLNYWVF